MKVQDYVIETSVNDGKVEKSVVIAPHNFSLPHMTFMYLTP
jgi:hypothetical protein